MTQNFLATAKQTGRERDYVKMQDTIKDVMGIVEGRYDTEIPENFLYIGKITK